MKDDCIYLEHIKQETRTMPFPAFSPSAPYGLDVN